MAMTNDQYTGPLRAIVPGIVAYLVGRGYLPESLKGAAGDFLMAAAFFGMAAWSYWSNRPAAQVAAVARMPGTVVSQGGADIKVIDARLAEVARESATDASGR